MCKRPLFVFIVIAVLHYADSLYAQFTDPRFYGDSPVGVNQIELDYAYGRANASIDTSLIVEGAEVNLNQGTIRYTRYFGLFHRTAWAQALVPIAGLNGSVTGTNIGRSIIGVGDSSYELAMLLRGGPALGVAQFASYKSTTSVGVSITITAPTGLYNPDKVLNLGSDRWSFKPEIGISHPFGPQQKWVVDAYANASFFTDDTSYHRVEILRQQALPGLEGHVSYAFTPNLWVAFDTRWSFRGDTFVNGMDENNGQQNFVLGSEMNVSLNPRNTLVLVFAKALVHQNGPAYTGFSVKYVYSWGKGYK
jgi:Putative MetA-pathway of phenol degradation